MKVEYLAPNHFIICTNKGRYLQSYQSIVAFISYTGKVVLGNHWCYSHTTSKYRNIFLEEDAKTTRNKLSKGIYTLDTNLGVI